MTLLPHQLIEQLIAPVPKYLPHRLLSVLRSNSRVVFFRVVISPIFLCLRSSCSLTFLLSLLSLGLLLSSTVLLTFLMRNSRRSITIVLFDFFFCDRGLSNIISIIGGVGYGALNGVEGGCD